MADSDADARKHNRTPESVGPWNVPPPPNPYLSPPPPLSEQIENFFRLLALWEQKGGDRWALIQRYAEGDRRQQWEQIFVDEGGEMGQQAFAQFDAIRRRLANAVEYKRINGIWPRGGCVTVTANLGAAE